MIRSPLWCVAAQFYCAVLLTPLSHLEWLGCLCSDNSFNLPDANVLIQISSHGAGVCQHSQNNANNAHFPV
jgi:hypothetical protein